MGFVERLEFRERLVPWMVSLVLDYPLRELVKFSLEEKVLILRNNPGLRDYISKT